MGTAAHHMMKRLFARFGAYLGICFVWLLFVLPYASGRVVPFPADFLVQFFAPWNASYAMPVKNNAMPDIITQIYPWKTLTIDTWKQGQVPLWNPYSFSGTPHAANNQSAVFSPFNALFFLFPFLRAWTIAVLLQPLLAGLFMVLFLRSLGRSHVASFIGGLSFMFCGFLTTWMAYATLGYAALFLPLALWGVVGIFGEHRRFVHPLAVAAAVAASFLSGHFQISLYVAGAVFLFIAYNAVITRQWKSAAMGILSLLSGILFSSVQLLLTFDAYRQSVRSVLFGPAEVIPWSYLITVIAPDFYGNPVTRNDWFGHYAEWSSYIGMLPFLLAGVSVFVSKYRKTVLFFSGLAVVSLFLAYKSPVSDLLFALRIPAISTSAASRILVLFSLSASVLAAFGLDALANREGSRKNIFIYVGFLLFVILAVWMLIVVKVLPADALGIAKRNFMLPTVLTLAGVLLMAGFAYAGKKKLVVSVLLAAVVGVSVFDSMRYATKWMPKADAGLVYPPVKSVEFLRTRAGYDRVFGNYGGEVGVTSKLQLIEGYDAVYQARYGEFINAVSTGIVAPGSRSVVTFDKYGRYAREALQLLGVRYIAYRISDGRNVWAFPVWQYPPEEMRSMYRDEHYELFDFSVAYPRAFLVDSYVVETDNQKIIDRLFAHDFNRRNTLVLEQEPDVKPETGTGSATIRTYTPNKIVIRTDAGAPKLLFLSDVYDPGWKASVDGVRKPVLRADYDFRAVALDTGPHTVEFTYEPVSYTKGLILLAVSAALLSGIGLWEAAYAHRVR